MSGFDSLNDDDVERLVRIIDSVEASAFDYLELEVGDLKVTLGKGDAPVRIGPSGGARDRAAAAPVAATPAPIAPSAPAPRRRRPRRSRRCAGVARARRSGRRERSDRDRLADHGALLRAVRAGSRAVRDRRRDNRRR